VVTVADRRHPVDDRPAPAGRLVLTLQHRAHGNADHVAGAPEAQQLSRGGPTRDIGGQPTELLVQQCVHGAIIRFAAPVHHRVLPLREASVTRWVGTTTGSAGTRTQGDPMVLIGFVLLAGAAAFGIDLVVLNRDSLDVEGFGQVVSTTPAGMFVAGIVTGLVAALGVMLLRDGAI